MQRIIHTLLVALWLLACSASTLAEDYEAYLFAYFTGNGPGEEQVHYAISDDGFNYKALNGNKPVIDSKKISSTGGVRDPHLLRSPDGKTFYMVLTDLYVPKMGWNNTKMVMLSSKDLVNWKHSVVDIPKQFPKKFGDVNRVWAPQTIYDAKARKYMVYFSMLQPGGPDIIYYAYANDDFTGLATEPKQLYFPPNPSHACIDADIVEKDGKFYFFFKGEGREPGIRLAVSDKLTEGYKLVSDERIDKEKAGVEGSGTFKLIGKDAWILMYDVYTRGRYQFTISEDLKTFEVVDQQVSMNFHPRHGSVLRITAEEKARLIKKWPIEASPADDGWGKNTWQGGGEHDAEKQGGQWVFALASDDGADMAWTKTFPVDPGKRYRLSGKIKTQGLKAQTGRGALFNIHGMEGVLTQAVSGNSNWTAVSVTFDSCTRESVMVNALFGGWGQSTGRA